MKNIYSYKYFIIFLQVTVLQLEIQQMKQKVQALSEIFERYVKIKIIKEGLSLPKFPDEIIKSFQKFIKTLKLLEI